MVLLPKAETPNLLTVQKKTKKVSEGTWARVKNGKYKGDLAQVQFTLLYMFPFHILFLVRLPPNLFMLYVLVDCGCE
jgi:hypothetical protein